MKSILRSATTLMRRLPIAAILLLLSLGARAQNLNLPLGVAVDSNSNIYVANLFGGITVYGPGFARKTTITQGVAFPASVAIGNDGTVYVANNGGNSITEYSAASFAQESLSIPITLPTQVVVGSYNEVYVVASNGTVSMFDPFGTLRSEVNAVNTETLVITPRLAQFWVQNSGSSTEPAFEYDMFTIDIAANLNGFVGGGPYTGFLPTRATPNLKTGDTWITDYINQHVIRVDANGNTTVEITPAGAPYGIALDTTKQRIYVTEPALNQVEVFSLTSLQRIGLLH